MIRHNVCRCGHRFTRQIESRRILLFVSILSICAFSSVLADDFAPFVIPARPNPNSLIAAAPGEAIRTSSERLVARSGHFYRGQDPVRLWGVDLSFNANLPTHKDAPYVAARMAAAGVNVVRCHHLDTDRWPRGIWNAQNGKTIAPEALDRLDYFIDQLARQGICVNINLHVGRAHSRYLGLPDPGTKYDKIAGIFTPELIDAQKQYARDLLTHTNPFRRVSYAADPAVAIVEITNEDSFFMWSGEQSLRGLPPYYADILRAKFNAWLKERYGSNEELRAAWAEGVQPLGENLLTNGDLRMTGPAGSVPQGWHLEQHEGCRASLSRRLYSRKDALFIEILKADETQWHLQLNQGGLSLKAGQYYTVIFEAAGERPRQLGCNVGQAHSPWGNLGLSRQAELTDQWQRFSYGFVCNADDDNARVNFAFSASTDPVYLVNVQLRPGGRTGLAEGEDLDAGNVALFSDNESPKRASDRMRFLAETEKQYFDGMRSFIRDELGSKALVTGTIVFGPLGLYAQSDMDFIDTHAYWQHPRFPGQPWDAENWLIDQKPMTDYPDQANVFNLAASRLADKPFTLSEYNHPAPLDAQAECIAMIASFAAAQDWDGIWLYTYSHSSDNWARENMNGYFDIDTNPAKWGFMRAGSIIFRDGGIQPFSGVSTISLAGSEDLLTSLIELHQKHDRGMFDVVAERARITLSDMLKRQISLALYGQSELKNPGGSDPVLDWFVENGRGFYAAWGSVAWAFAGHENRYESSTGGRISVTSPAFVAMTITALDGAAINSSRAILVTACGRCENTGMIFSADRRTVGRNWGGPPVMIETVKGTVTLPAGQWKCQTLGPDGMATREVLINDGVLRLSPEYGTMWYLLTR